MHNLISLTLFIYTTSGEDIQFGGDDHPMILEDIYIPGLVAAHGGNGYYSKHKYLRTSADGVVIFYENVEPTEDEEDSNTGFTRLMPVECKSRQTPRTWSRERNRQNLLRYGDYNLTDIRNGLELEHLTLQQQHGSSNTLQLLSIVSINGAMQQKTYGSIHHYNMLVMPTMKEHPTSTHTNY